MSIRLTQKIIVAATAGLVAYDVWAAANGREGDTLSEVITEAAYRHPVVAVAFGALGGHWFWRPRARRPAGGGNTPEA